MRVRYSKKFSITVLAAAFTISAGLFAAMQQRGAAATQPVTDDLHIDEFLPATLAPDVVLPDPFSGFQSARDNEQTTVQWGWLDPLLPPKRTIRSGDNIAIETMLHSHNLILPDRTAPNGGPPMSTIVDLRLANPRGGPHTVTGPVAIEGARAPYVMEVRIKRIVTKGVGFNFNLPGGPGSPFAGIGALNDDPRFSAGFVKYFFFEPDKRRVEFKPGITVDLKPFPGVLAVGIDPDDPSLRRTDVKGVFVDPNDPAHPENKRAPVSTLRPWKNGSNMDLNELGEGSTLFIPIFLDDGLLWTGDSHCRQGNGEINLTALECSYDHVVLQPIVRTDLNWQEETWRQWPMAETKTDWILMGFDEDLDKAFKIAASNTVEFLTTMGLTPPEGYSLSSIVADCRVTQVVDIRKGVHCLVPKKIFSKAQSS